MNGPETFVYSKHRHGDSIWVFNICNISGRSCIQTLTLGKDVQCPFVFLSLWMQQVFLSWRWLSMGSFRRGKPSSWRLRYNVDACCGHNTSTFNATNVCFMHKNKPASWTWKSTLSLFINESVTIVSLQTDSSILGGMIVSIGDKYVDMSTKTKIQKLTKLIKET